jgi:hypothetical protein
MLFNLLVMSVTDYIQLFIIKLVGFILQRVLLLLHLRLIILLLDLVKNMTQLYKKAIK